MELRQLQAFVAVATELHFGRAADRLMIAQPTLSELISRLERELGTPLLTRTTRRVALTAAGEELLSRATAILADVGAAAAAVRQIADGTGGTVRVGMTPPVAPILAPHLKVAFAGVAPQVRVEFERLWLPTLTSALVAGTIDIALTCGVVPTPAGVASRVLCAEPLLVGLRADHRFADLPAVSLDDLAHETLGRPRDSLFPAWALAHRQAIVAAAIDPPSVELDDADLAAGRWHEQADVDWILLVGSLATHHAATVIKPLTTDDAVPFSLLWCQQPEPGTVVRRFIETASESVPDGWQRPPSTVRSAGG